MKLRIHLCLMGFFVAFFHLLPSTANATGPSCQDAYVTVGVGLFPPKMHGTLCLPPGGGASTVMVLLPGASYNHTYWDFPYQEPTYNFRRAMNYAGYATFVVDLLGTGNSSRPLSALVTITTQANGVHKVIQALRTGAIGGIAFNKVILGGHSRGSMAALAEASTYHDVDAVLLTGVAHLTNPPGVLNLFTQSFYPAFLDPAFAGQGYDPGYLTSRPGTRSVFYTPGQADPAVIAVDELTKDVFSSFESADGVPSIIGPSSLLIHVPVMVAIGQLDSLFCGPLATDCSSSATLYAQESLYYNPTACLQTYVLEGAGHDMNLFPNAPVFQNIVANWANTFVGSGPATPPPGSCPN